MSGIETELAKLSSGFDRGCRDLSIILAAGHGKRIKSHTPKMLHEIWGVPTVVRVSDATRTGLRSVNQIVVVGINALEIAATIGKGRGRAFVHQEEQKGTGHAVQIAIKYMQKEQFSPENIYVFPGDMGLITTEATRDFHDEFEKSKYDMMVLSGIYSGNPLENVYGRMLRVPSKDRKAFGRIIEIKEFKDILSLRKPYKTKFGKKEYSFAREYLLDIQEFNSGVYALKGKALSFIGSIKPDNVQKEVYLTDMVQILNGKRLPVGVVTANVNDVVFAFNDKSALKRMEEIARDRVYEKLKNIVTLKNREDFFIADEVVSEIIELDKKGKMLDIQIGKGAYVGKGVSLGAGVVIKDNARIEGNVRLAENVSIGERAHLSAYPGQTLKVGSGSEVLQGDIIKGNLEIGRNSRIESSVNMTGSDENPVRIGNGVLIKGTSYIFGSIVEDNVWIEHSVLKNKRIKCARNKDGTVKPVRYILPFPEGLDSIEDLR